VAPYGSGSGAALLASARSQIGQIQDCTAMVERALGSIGIVTGDLAPAQFFQFGTVVATPAPGDILISAGHVGIYAGNGMMVSGGFNNMHTVEHPVSYVGAFTAVRVA
jgi:cell wall-associated NlpC family hydrolase